MNFEKGDRVVYAGNDSFVGEVELVTENAVYVEGDGETRSYDHRDLERYEDVVRAYEFEEWCQGDWRRTTRVAHPDEIAMLDEDEYRNVRELTYV